MNYRKGAVAIFVIASGFLSGCDSDRLTQFGDFAAAGTSYVAAFHTLTKGTGTAVIAADSSFEAIAKPPSIPTAAQSDRYRNKLAADDAKLQKYLADLQTLDTHADLLGAYFAAVTQLTDGKASAATVNSMNGLITAIGGLNSKIEAFKFGDKGVQDYAGIATGFIIARFEVKELNKQLLHDAPIIDRALALQQGAIGALAADLKASLDTSLKTEEDTKVINPYVANGPLPPTWAADRDAFLRKSATLSSAENAQNAIKTLRSDFETLVQNKDAKINWQTLLSQIASMVNYSAATTTSSNL